MWFVVVTLAQSSSEKEHTESEEMLKFSLRRKGMPESAMKLSPVSKETKSLRKRPMLNGIREW